MATLPALDQINVTGARLPAAYSAACDALARCASIDECQTWKNKAYALASYARQADDDTLQKTAMRIQSRAVRRCGELLKDFDGRGGDQSKREGDHLFASNGAVPTQREAAEQAGMSPHQQKQAVRVANVPADLFEEAVESDAPPTVTALAGMGRRHQTDGAVSPFKPHVITLASQARRMAEFCAAHDAPTIAQAVEDYQLRELRTHVTKVRRWLSALAPLLRETTDGL